MVKRYEAVKGPGELPPHASMGFNNTWIFLNDVLPRAIKKYGGFDPESLRKAALETDIPVGGTMQGYGVKFYPPGHPLAGQNERAFPVVMQYVERPRAHRLAEGSADRRPGAALPEGPRVRTVTTAESAAHGKCYMFRT